MNNHEAGGSNDPLPGNEHENENETEDQALPNLPPDLLFKILSQAFDGTNYVTEMAELAETHNTRMTNMAASRDRQQQEADMYQRFMDDAEPKGVMDLVQEHRYNNEWHTINAHQALYRNSEQLRDEHQNRADQINNTMDMYREQAEHVRKNFYFYMMAMRRYRDYGHFN